MMLIRTRVGPSAIHGLGLFAIEAVPRGTPVWRFEPTFDRVFTAAQCAALPPAVREHLRWFGFFSREDGSVTLSGDHSCFMNHSPTPNTGAPLEAVPPLTTAALRDIGADEELTCDYFAFDAEAQRKLDSK